MNNKTKLAIVLYFGSILIFVGSIGTFFALDGKATLSDLPGCIIFYLFFISLIFVIAFTVYLLVLFFKEGKKPKDKDNNKEEK